MIPEPLSFEWWGVFFAGICSLAIFSFLIKENPFYRFFEHLFIGIATSITIMMTVKTFIWPRMLRPLFDLERPQFPDGSYAEPYNQLYLLMLIPMAFGSLYYFVLSRRFAWLAQLVIGFSLGVAAGFAFEGTFNEIIPQIVDSFRSLYVPGADLTTASGFFAGIANIVFTLTLLASLSYFFFTFRRASGSIAERSSHAGRWMMMCCFGAFFGSTIAARMALLVERLDFLLHTWTCSLFRFLPFCNG
jgi:hypothetical protein